MCLFVENYKYNCDFALKIHYLNNKLFDNRCWGTVKQKA